MKHILCLTPIFQTSGQHWTPKFKVVLDDFHKYFFGVKVKTVRFLAARSGLNVRTYGLNDLKAAIYACPNHTDDDIYSDQGYLDPVGPP